MTWKIPTASDRPGAAAEMTCRCGRVVPSDMLRDFTALGLGELCDACDARLVREGLLDPVERLERLGAPRELVDRARARQGGRS